MVEEEKEVNQPKEYGNGFGIAGFILGLLSVLLIWFFSPAWILAILGLIFSIIQLKKKKTGLAVAGLVLSIIGIILPLILVAAVTLIWAVVIPQMQEDLESSSSMVCFDASALISVVDDGTTCLADNGVLNVKVTRGAGEFDLSRLDISLSHEGNSRTKKVTSNLPSPGSESIFQLTDLGLPSVSAVSVAAVVMTSEGEKICDGSRMISVSQC